MVTPETFRATMGLFATGVTVVSTTVGGVLHGMTASAFASVSIDPLLVLVCVDRRAGLHDLVLESRAFAVTVLAADQEEESVWFASPRRPGGRDQFDHVAWWPAPVSGSPVLERGLGWLDCRLAEAHGAGDHSIFVAEPVGVGRLRDAEPLLYFRGGYRRMRPEGELVGGQDVPNSRSPKSPRPGTM